MFGFIKKLLGLETPAPKKEVKPVVTITETPAPVVQVEAVVPTVETKPKKKTAKISTGTRKPRKKKD